MRSKQSCLAGMILFDAEPGTSFSGLELAARPSYPDTFPAWIRRPTGRPTS